MVSQKRGQERNKRSGKHREVKRGSAHVYLTIDSKRIKK
jgi:hypothetical protein